MNGIPNDKLYDLWRFTLEAYDYSTDFAVLLPRHQWLICDAYLAPGNIEYETGTQIKRQVQYAEGVAHWHRPAASRTRSSGRFLTEFTAPWVGIYGEMTMIAAELRRNLGKARLKNLRTSRSIAADLGILKEIEQRMWMLPDSATDDLHPRGFPYYLKPMTSAQLTTHTTAGTSPVGYEGQNPSGFDDCGGIDASSSTYSRWRNLCGSWTNTSAAITETDMIRLGQMWRRMHWRAPKKASDLDSPAFSKLRIATDEAIVDAYSRFVRQQNDDLGVDGGRFYGAGLNEAGEPTFKGLPLTWVEDLDNTSADTTELTTKGYHPWYWLHLGVFKPIFERGMFFTEDTPPRDWEQPDVFTTFRDCAFQNFCENRQQAGGVMSYPYA